MAIDYRRAPQSLSPQGRKERVDYLRPIAVPGVEILEGYNSSDPWRAFHERYAVVPCLTANAGWRYRSKEHRLEDQSIMFLEPGEIHANTRVHKPADFKVIFVEPEVFIREAQALGITATPHFRIAQGEDPGLFTALYEFCSAVAQGAGALEQQSRFAICLRRMLGYVEKPPRVLPVGSEHRAVQRAKAYLQERFHTSVTLDELAAVTDMSRFHLLRTFAKRVGLPPHAYQLRVQVERACKLLRSGMPPKLVASAVGFADQSHLTRAFGQTVGTSPGLWRRARRA